MKEESIDLISILKNIWCERKLILKITLSFFIAGCILALLSPIVYTSHTSFVPQVSEDNISSVDKGIGSLASIAGIDLNPAETGDSYLSPLLYSKLAESEEFSYDLIKQKIVNSSGNKLTIKEYLLSETNSFNLNPISLLKKYTIDLFLNNESKEKNIDIHKGYNFLSPEDFNLINVFRGKFRVELFQKEGYIKVIATDKDAFVSTQLAEKITINLQSKIIKLRTKKIKERLIYSKEQYDLKQSEFDFLQKKLAEFKDSNKNISTASFRAELQKLESEYQIQQNILINLASEYNKNKIKLNKDTPIFSVIDEVSIPNTKSAPKRSLIVIIYLFIGLIISISYVLTKETIINLVNEIKA